MLEYKQSTQIRVPIRLLSATNTGVAGVLYSAITVSIKKADGTVSAFVPTAGQWAEATTGAFFQTGTYDLIVPSSYTDQVGPFVVAVVAGGANPAIGAFKIIANENGDIYSAVSTVQTTTNAISSIVTLLQKVEQNHWKIVTTGPDANKLVIYDNDGVTPLLKFALFDGAGNSTFINPFERVPTS